MVEKDKNVRIGDGVADRVKQNLNENMSSILIEISDLLFDYIKNKIMDMPKDLEKLLNDQKAKQEMIAQWSNSLYEKGLIPKGYDGLTDEMLISNFHQQGYLEGLYAGYVLTMMALVDCDADKELIFSMRDTIRPYLIGHHYDNRDEFYSKYKTEAYKWIETTLRENNE